MEALRQQRRETELYVIRGFKGLDKRIATLANTAWMIAYTALWHTEYVAEEEKEQTLRLIKAILMDTDDPQDAYTDLVQRILLTRQYIILDVNRYVPAPTRWFDPSNKYGFAGTKEWLRQVEVTRKSFPLYKQYLKVFAEAIQEISETGAAEDFHYWRSYLIERGWNQLVNLLLATVGNMRFEE